jgi:hypothetical protein
MAMTDVSGVDPNLDPNAIARLLAANSMTVLGCMTDEVMDRVSALILAHKQVVVVRPLTKLSKKHLVNTKGYQKAMLP